MSFDPPSLRTWIVRFITSYLVSFLLISCSAPAASTSVDTASPAEENAKPMSYVVKRGVREATMSFVFLASKELVFDAMTDPDQLRQWLAVGERRLTECEIDLREGGKFRYVFDDGKSPQFTMHGEYLEVSRPHRIVHLESYAGSDWPPLNVTTTFSYDANGTVLTTTILYPSEEIRDQDFPNLQHAVATYVRLAGFLAQRQQELQEE